ncbi:aspartate/methionine/tyrosine aminotransferase [Breoghania corrubedonensis]|uniref:aspartate transaminase n=1 Tax=Breoghania corrubedonensis TaxID=665038 RepID=A0A2T5V9W5_9HYPH|nr:pyridoxal phosphate-dependent aminotransferase [Breoghania corrubedonensis]PTW60552.1 aspartate/methionine/tyrosine aminotransferase [Breoghania corrubedonensis]
MSSIAQKFETLRTDNAPGQEARQQAESLDRVMKGEALCGRPVDFSHGDVDAFEPTPGAFETFCEGVRAGGRQAYTEYRGKEEIREALAGRLATFTGAPLSGAQELILTPGTQGALFLAIASTVGTGDKVAIVQPDYFANRKLVQFFDGEICPVQLDYLSGNERAGLDLNELEDAFRAGVRVFIFSNPSNPTGAIYSPHEIRTIAELADRYGVTVIADQLYSRLHYSDGGPYTHLRAVASAENVVTIMGPSKTESLSGYRLGAAFGPAGIIERMERLQAIVSLRAAGYNQSVLRTWLAEPEGWLEERIRLHQNIRDDLLATLREGGGIRVRTPQAGSYLFAKMPELTVSPLDFVRILRHQADVIVTPGSEFSPHALDSVRLNFSQDHAAAKAAVERIVVLADRYRK